MQQQGNDTQSQFQKHCTPTQVAAYCTVIGFCISIVVLSEITQITVEKFHDSFLIRYVNTAQQACLYVIILVWKCYRSYSHSSTNLIRCKQTNAIPTPDAHAHSHSHSQTHSTSIIAKAAKNTKSHRDKFTPLQLFMMYSVVAGSVNMLSGVCLTLSLSGTTVSSNNAIAGIRPVCVLIVSAMVLREKISVWMVLAMVLALFGIAFFVLEITLNSHSSGHKKNEHDTYWGILLSIAAHFGFGMHDIFAKKVFLDCLIAPQKLVIGCVFFLCTESLCTLPFFAWIFFFPDNLFGGGGGSAQLRTDFVENVNWILGNGYVIIVLHMLIYVGISLKSPFYINIGTLLAIPLSFIVDNIFIHHYMPHTFAVIGAILIVCSFLMLEILKPCKSILFCNRVLVNKGHDYDGKRVDEQSKHRKNRSLAVNEGNGSDTDAGNTYVKSKNNHTHNKEKQIRFLGDKERDYPFVYAVNNQSQQSIFGKGYANDESSDNVDLLGD